MRRRDFISLLGSAAAVWPFAAGAQQAASSTIGFLGPASAAGVAPFVEAYQRGLRRDRLRRGQEPRNRIPLGGQ